MKMKLLILLITLFIVSSGCISETTPTTITPPTAPEVVATSSPPPEHYPEAPRPTTAAPQAQEKPEIELTIIPSESHVGTMISIRWRVTGANNSAVHSALHYGTESKPGVFGFNDGPGAAGYPSLTTEFASGDFSLPRDFVARITPVNVGVIYLRAHAIIDGKNYWTDEKTITIKAVPVQPTIEITNIPTEADAGSTISISWTVTGDGLSATHSAIHYGNDSKAGMLGLDSGPGAAGYPSLTTEFTSGDFSLPRDFTGTIIPTNTGTIYLRAHAIIDGNNYWTDEKTVTVKTPSGSSIY